MTKVYIYIISPKNIVINIEVLGLWFK